jgi:hypothetical protein
MQKANDFYSGIYQPAKLLSIVVELLNKKCFRCCQIVNKMFGRIKGLTGFSK